MSHSRAAVRSAVCLLAVTVLLVCPVLVPRVHAAAGDGWTFVDGNLATGLNKETVRHAVNPVMVVFGSDLYAAWSEFNTSTSQIRVRRYNASTWSWVDGGGAAGINYDTGQNAIHPTLAVFGGNLYAIWSETYAGVYVTRVKRYDGGSAWTSIDGSVTNGLNKDSATTGSTSGPSLVVNNGYLYATWVESYSGAGGAYQVHVKRYDSGSSWSFVDGGGFTGLNYDTNRSANKPTLCSINNTLYLVWTEANPSAKYIVRVKRYDGGSTWTTVDGGSGLNYNASYGVDQARLVVYNNTLYAYWLENYFVRMKSYNGSVWSTADGSSGFKQNALNYAYAESAPVAIPYGSRLYFTWGEDISYDPWSIQTRAAWYVPAAMTFIDGNDWTTGLNHNRLQYAYKQSLVDYNGVLYVAWYESNGTANQVRVRSTLLPPSPTAVTHSGNGWYTAGQNLDLTVTFNRIVNVTGTPTIPVALMSGAVSASYLAGSGTASLTFRYTVATGDNDTDGIAPGTSIALNGGTIRDAVNGMDAALTLSGVASTSGVFVDALAPTRSSTTPADNATGVGYNQNLVVFFSENVSKGTGNVVIRRTLDDALVETIPVSAASVSVSTNAATIDPSVTFANWTGYYVLIDAGAFVDSRGNAFAGIGSKTAWDFVTVDSVAPSGYTVSIDQAYVNNDNKTAMSFTFSGAEVGTTYNYTLTSSGGGTPVTGSGTAASATQQVGGVNTLGLNDGTLTLSVTLSDASGNTGGAATATVLKDTLVPDGYTVSIDQAYVNNDNKTALSFTFAGAVVGTTCEYTLTSSGGGTPVTGSGSITSATQQVSGVNTLGLNEGTLTLSATLTDTSLNTGVPATDTVVKDTSMPTGYTASIDQAYVNRSNRAAVSFLISGAETGADYTYSIASSGGGGVSVGGFGTVTSGTSKPVTGIDTSTLPDGTLTLSFTMSDVAGNSGEPVTDTVAMDTVAPFGYTVAVDQPSIEIANEAATSFTFAGAEVGTTYSYSVTSTGGWSTVTGSGSVTSTGQTVSGVDLSGLNRGSLTLSTTLTDTAGNTGTPATASVVKNSAPPTSFYTLTPCRLVDTRNATGSYGGPALAANKVRLFTLVGQCDIPANVAALSVNVTATGATQQGRLVLFPAGETTPTASTINYVVGVTRANNAVAPLNGLGQLAVYCGQLTGTVHMVLDVNGYYQ